MNRKLVLTHTFTVSTPLAPGASPLVVTTGPGGVPIKVEPPDLVFASLPVVGAGTVHVELTMPVIDPATTHVILKAHAIIATASHPANGNAEALVAASAGDDPNVTGLSYNDLSGVIDGNGGKPLTFDFVGIAPAQYILSVVQDNDSDGDAAPPAGPTEVAGGPTSDDTPPAPVAPAPEPTPEPAPVVVVTEPVPVVEATPEPIVEPVAAPVEAAPAPEPPLPVIEPVVAQVEVAPAPEPVPAPVEPTPEPAPAEAAPATPPAS